MTSSTIFIPKTVKIGFCHRSDTYTGKLAYVIYYDQKGKLRKETSWESWRDKKIDPVDIENESIEGLVLNKKVGDYSGDWGSHRAAYCRVFDPRNGGFEYEITIENLLWILESSSSIKGKGLEGKFVFGWDGKDLILVPCESPDYIRIAGYSDMLKNPESITGKNIIVGATYRTNKGEDWIYLGRYNKYEDWKWSDEYGKNEGLHYFFQHGTSYETLKSLSGKIVKLVSSDIVENYAEMMEALSHKDLYSPVVDRSKDEYVEYTLEEFEKEDKGKRFWVYYNGSYIGVIIHQRYSYSTYNSNAYYLSGLDPCQFQKEYSTYFQYGGGYSLHELYRIFHFSKRVQYLRNGKILQK